MKLLDLILLPVSVYLVVNTLINFGGRADSLSSRYAAPFAVSAFAAGLCLFVAFRRVTAPVHAIAQTAVVTLAIVLAADLAVSAISSKLVMFILFALIPLEAWRLARARLPAHTWLVTGAAFGLVVTPVSRGLESLLFADPLLFLPLWVIGWASEAIHYLPGYGLGRSLGLLPLTDLTDADWFFRIAPLSGAFWGLIYGYLGSLVDRRRKRPGHRRAPREPAGKNTIAS